MRDNLKASGRLGSYLSVSIAFTVWRETPSFSAKSDCDHSLAVRPGQPFKAVIVPKAPGNPRVVCCAVQRRRPPSLADSRAATIMKAIGRKCGWVIPKKERRVLALLRTHTCERDYDFVTESSGNPGRKPIRVKVDFAQEGLSAFEPTIQVVTNPDALAA